MSLDINLQRFQTAEHVPTLAQCQQYIAATLLHVDNAPDNGELTIRIIDPTESARLNETFRKKSGPTNVLSFDYDSPDGSFTGDLAICADIVESEANTQHKPIAAHWAHLIIHGTLHLLGFDHETNHDAEIMEALEIKIMHKLNFESPY